MRGRRFSSEDELKDTVSQWFEEQDKDFKFSGISSACEMAEVCRTQGRLYLERVKTYFFLLNYFTSR
jgi:hypothetical protein